MSATLHVDRTRCDGYGMCAELLPELIRLDEWGFPILRSNEVPGHLRELAERAVEACPVLALRVMAAARRSGHAAVGDSAPLQTRTLSPQTALRTQGGG